MQNSDCSAMHTCTPVHIVYHSTLDFLQGLNSYFEITLEKDGQPYYDFAPLPKEVFSESSILIRVNNSVGLDYEKTRSATFDVSNTKFSNFQNILL